MNWILWTIVVVLAAGPAFALDWEHAGSYGLAPNHSAMLPIKVANHMTHAMVGPDSRTTSTPLVGTKTSFWDMVKDQATPVHVARRSHDFLFSHISQNYNAQEARRVALEAQFAAFVLGYQTRTAVYEKRIADQVNHLSAFIQQDVLQQMKEQITREIRTELIQAGCLKAKE